MSKSEKKEFCRTCWFAAVGNTGGECSLTHDEINTSTEACEAWEPTLEYRQVLALEALASCVADFSYGPRFKTQPPVG